MKWKIGFTIAVLVLGFIGFILVSVMINERYQRELIGIFGEEIMASCRSPDQSDTFSFNPSSNDRYLILTTGSSFHHSWYRKLPLSLRAVSADVLTAILCVDRSQEHNTVVLACNYEDGLGISYLRQSPRVFVLDPNTLETVHWTILHGPDPNAPQDCPDLTTNSRTIYGAYPSHDSLLQWIANRGAQR